MLTENKIKVNKHLLFNEITYIYFVNNQQKGIKNGKRTSLSNIVYFDANYRGIIAVVIYFAGIFYFGSKCATFEQCIGWLIPWLFIGSIVVTPIYLLVKW